MQHSKRVTIIGECHANLALAELLAEQLGIQARSKHCGNVVKCTSRLEKDASIELAVIDYERESATQKRVDKCIERSGCTCTNWNKGVRLCECRAHGAKRLIILLEGGVEETLEKLGYTLDPKVKARLKSDKVLSDVRERIGKTYEMLRDLASHVARLRETISPQ